MSEFLCINCKRPHGHHKFGRASVTCYNGRPYKSRPIWKAKDSFKIASREGTAYSGTEPDPAFTLGELILIKYEDHIITGTIKGLERHPTIDMGRPGSSVGVWLGAS